MSKRFCEQCGTALEAGARFCGSCGVRVDEVVAVPSLPAPAPLPAAPVAATPPLQPRPAAPLFQPAAAVPHLPVRRGPSAAAVLGGLALILVLLGGAGVWLYGRFFADTGSDARLASPPSTPAEAPADDPEALIPGRAPPSLGGSRLSGSADDEVPFEAVDPDAPAGIIAAPADDPRSAAGRPPPRLQGGPAASDQLPPIPVTDDPVDLDGLRAAVTAANVRDIDALYAASPDPRSPETRDALDVAIRALAKGLYRHHVVDGHGDLDSARAELRAFLSGQQHKGLGLSEDAIEAGVAHVGP